MVDTLDDFEVKTLADCNRMALSPLDLSGNSTSGDYTPEAAQFVRHHFGVDPTTVDWHAANAARLINAQFVSTAPFDPAPARAALRRAIERHTRGRRPALTTAGRTPARTHPQRRLPPRPGQ